MTESRPSNFQHSGSDCFMPMNDPTPLCQSSNRISKQSQVSFLEDEARFLPWSRSRESTALLRSLENLWPALDSLPDSDECLRCGRGSVCAAPVDFLKSFSWDPIEWVVAWNACSVGKDGDGKGLLPGLAEPSLTSSKGRSAPATSSVSVYNHIFVYTCVMALLRLWWADITHVDTTRSIACNTWQ